MHNVIKVYLFFKFNIRREILEWFEYEFTSTKNDSLRRLRKRVVSHFFYSRVQFISQLRYYARSDWSENKVILEIFCYHVSYWCLQYRRQTLITVFALSLLTLVLFYESKGSYFRSVCRLVTQAFPRVHRSSNQRDSIISNTKQGKFKRQLHKEKCLNKNGKMFPCCLVYYYFHGLQLDKLSEYALTEVKHRFSGKRRALSNSLKAIS